MIAAEVALTGLLTRYLFEVKPTDPVTFIKVSLLLLTAFALFASWLPARARRRWIRWWRGDSRRRRVES